MTKKKEIEPEDFTPQGNDFAIKPLKFKNVKQKNFFQLIKDPESQLVICNGPAGVGKNMIALYSGLKLLKQGKYEQILYVRTPVDSSDTKIGFLKGDLFEKTTNYMFPLDEKLDKFLKVDARQELLRSGQIETTVNTFMRGRSIDNTFVIIDEMQNFSLREAQVILSRFESNTKIVAIGDHTQSDIGGKSCLKNLMSMFGDEDAQQHGVFTFEFDVEDIVRSGLTQYVIETFNKYRKFNR